MLSICLHELGKPVVGCTEVPDNICPTGLDSVFKKDTMVPIENICKPHESKCNCFKPQGITIKYPKLSLWIIKLDVALV